MQNWGVGCICSGLVVVGWDGTGLPTWPSAAVKVPHGGVAVRQASLSAALRGARSCTCLSQNPASPSCSPPSPLQNEAKKKGVIGTNHWGGRLGCTFGRVGFAQIQMQPYLQRLGIFAHCSSSEDDPLQVHTRQYSRM